MAKNSCDFVPFWHTTLGIRTKPAVPAGAFQALLRQTLTTATINAVLQRHGPPHRRPLVVTGVQLIESLVFHGVAEAGTLAQHFRELTGKKITDGAHSQRRALLPIIVFEELLRQGLQPKADPRRHPASFYRGLRLCGIDGSTFPVTNTPQIKARMRKAQTRRGRAAFPKVGVTVLLELGLHNPLAAALGAAGESGMVPAKQVLAAQPAHSLLLADRYDGVGEVLVRLPAAAKRHFLARVKRRLKRRLVAGYPDGSALVEIRAGKQTRLVREIVGRVRRGGRGRGTTVHLWTSLLDWRQHPAGKLPALYARRWEQECFYKELKVDARTTTCLQSHTALTALQELAALLLAYAALVDYRVAAGELAEAEVLRISFFQTLQAVQGLWRCMELAGDLLRPAQIRLLVRRTLRQLAEKVLAPRRGRSCPRAVRQPVSSWPRLRRNRSKSGVVNHSLGEICA